MVTLRVSTLKEGIFVDKKKQNLCQEDMDIIHHQLVEQIARISVDEEEERMKDELELNYNEGANQRD